MAGVVAQTELPDEVLAVPGHTQASLYSGSMEAALYLPYWRAYSPRFLWPAAGSLGGVS